MDITLDLPSELAIPLSVAGYDGEKLTEEVKQLLAVTFFQRNVLSLGKLRSWQRCTYGILFSF